MGTRYVEGFTFNLFSVYLLSYVANDLGSPAVHCAQRDRGRRADRRRAGPDRGERVSDRVGRKPVYRSGTSALLFAFPAAALVQHGTSVTVFIAFGGGVGVLDGVIYGPLAAFWAELFSTRVGTRRWERSSTRRDRRVRADAVDRCVAGESRRRPSVVAGDVQRADRDRQFARRRERSPRRSAVISTPISNRKLGWMERFDDLDLPLVPADLRRLSATSSAAATDADGAAHRDRRRPLGYLAPDRPRGRGTRVRAVRSPRPGRGARTRGSPPRCLPRRPSG